MKKIFLLISILCLGIALNAQEEKLRVAVLDPTTSGISMDGGTKLAVQELISSAFVSTGKFIVIERSMIDKIIKEQAFQNSDMADNSQATEIGKLAGANKVVLSAVSLVGGRNMLSIKVIDVMTASIDQQKTKIVGSNDLLDVVEPLTLELLGEEAIYVKQNTVLENDNTGGGTYVSASNSSSKKKASTMAAPKQTIDYAKEDKELCKQISNGIEALKATSNPKLAKAIESGKLKTSFTLGRGLSAELSESGILRISGTGEMLPTDIKLLNPYVNFTTAIVIEEGVTKICAFELFKNVQYVSLPNSLQSIEANCFHGCSQLLSVNIPAKLTKIGNNAFKGCEKLSSAFLPANLEYIGQGAFSGCEHLFKINIPTTVQIIPEECFENCSSLVAVVIPNSVKAIGKQAFKGCSGITNLYLPDNITSIGEASFYGMKNLNEIRLSENLGLIPAKAFADCKSLSSLTCPESVKGIGEESFANCKQLFKITFLSENMTNFGEKCFEDCESLGNIVLYSLRPPKCDDLFDDDDVYERCVLSVNNSSVGLYKKTDCWDEFDAINGF